MNTPRLARGLQVGATLLLLTSCTRSRLLAPSQGGSRSSAPPEASAPPSGWQLETTCVSSAAEVCFDAIDNNCNGLLEEGCGVTGGLIQVAAGWDEPKADVDLLVTDPTGDVARPGAPTASGLFKERDCPGTEQACQGKLMENVYLEDGTRALPGRYRVVLRLEKTGGAKLPVRVHLGARLANRTYGFAVNLTRLGEEKTFLFYR